MQFYPDTRRASRTLGSRSILFKIRDNCEALPISSVALTTGWDCPRAEVMVSLRPSKDSTTIAQLVGRMIRTPGATHAPDPRLESVMLYLPYYNQTEVQKVVDEIATDTEGAAIVELATEQTQKNPDVPDEAVSKINFKPSIVRVCESQFMLEIPSPVDILASAEAYATSR